MFNWFNRQQCQSFSKAESGSASSATVAEIFKYFFQILNIRMLNWNKTSCTASTLIKTSDC